MNKDGAKSLIKKMLYKMNIYIFNLPTDKNIILLKINKSYKQNDKHKIDSKGIMVTEIKKILIKMEILKSFILKQFFRIGIILF